MTMALADKLVPDDVLAAARTARDAAGDAAPSVGVWLRYVLFYAGVVACAGACGFWLLRAGWISAAATDGWKTVSTLLTILSGFMITTMLFTGKVEAAKSLTSVQLEVFAQKSNHLLFSQWLTLLNHIASLVAVGAVVGLGASAPSLAQWVACAAVGLIALSFLRSMLIPLQIIELHRFVHAALIREKQDEEGKQVIT
ncbi:hypothetical protein [Xanthomonas sacchari]|uniref:hypothetical protein n=1 Tax=Xanthomonas sacchari TaxID=56458 RepID=UPI002259946C|nr:hypothetical protein [Xanthomonas sacchari]